MEQPVSADAVSSYKGLIDIFCCLVIDPKDFIKKKRIVESFKDRVIPLGYPNDWYLLGGSGKAYWETYSARAHQLLCCDSEHLFALGLCGRTSNPTDALSYTETGVNVMFSGDYGRIYVYSCHEDVLYLVANTLEEFARYGVSRCFFTYKETISVRMSPVDSDYLKWISSETIPRGTPGRELFIVFAHGERFENTSVGYTRFIDEIHFCGGR